MDQSFSNILKLITGDDPKIPVALLKFGISEIEVLEVINDESKKLKRTLSSLKKKNIKKIESNSISTQIEAELSRKFTGENFHVLTQELPKDVLIAIVIIHNEEKLSFQKLKLGTEAIKLMIRIQDNDSLNKAVNSIDSTFYVMDANVSEFHYLSKSIESVVGYTPDEIINGGTLIYRRIHREYFPFLKNFVSKAKRGEKVIVEFKIADKSGKERYIRQSAYPVYRRNKIVNIAGLITDVSSERKEIIKLIDSEEKFRVLVETASDLIFTLDENGNIVNVNKNGAASLNFIPSEMIGKHLLEFVHERSKEIVSNAFKKLLESDIIIPLEIDLMGKSNKSVSYEIVVRSTFSNNKLEEVLGIGREISKRKSDERELQELNSKLVEANRIISIERDRAKQQITVLEELGNLKNQFIANVSHELRTPLASIVGFAETIATDTELSHDNILEFNNIILTEGKRLANLINDILDFSRLESNREQLEVESFDLVYSVKNCVEGFRSTAHENNITINTEIPDASIIISGDKERINKAFGKLIGNAIKFTNKSGRISIIVQDFLREVEIAISDTGIGIPQEEIPKLFQKFSKISRPGREIPGAGFGLVTVKKIIDLHNGIIRVNSELNKGSTFIIRLPKNN